LLFAQKKTTTSAVVSFDATTAIDALPKAENKTVVAALDTKTGSLAFEANVKNFAFSNPMIQDHFNGEKWLNSSAHPTFTYKGKITNLSEINFAKDGTYKAKTEGVLKVRGTEKNIEVPATIVVKSGAISASSDFSIKLSDYSISGAPIDGGKVAKEPKITVRAEFK
jgi:polyisoprenoid-binding protein YceI